MQLVVILALRQCSREQQQQQRPLAAPTATGAAIVTLTQEIFLFLFLLRVKCFLKRHVCCAALPQVFSQYGEDGILEAVFGYICNSCV